ncbi:MAG TPA: metallophosphoesterase [Nodosilinea sp.]|nr:metallophosphoesterase [Nodosilinea sp.]
MTLGFVEIEIAAGCDRIALCGGPYSNFAAVAAFLEKTTHIPQRFCLGDMGGFGPLPNRTLELLRQADIVCLQGNYDRAVGAGERDCGCGYTDPQDRQFAQISYDYTYAHTAPAHRQWLCGLPQLIRLRWRDRAVLLCHGSPDQTNEFVWESTTADAWIQAQLERYGVDGICATHTGIPWVRSVPGGFWCNVGVLGRPAHEGLPQVYYAELEFPAGAERPRPRIVPLTYDPRPVAAAMATAGLPKEFQESLLSGVWTTCAEILPPVERGVRVRVPLGEPGGS